MTDWSHDLILEFLDVYRYESVLWDPSHPWHKDKKKVNEAWSRMSEVLQRPVSELKKKKDSVMATFRGHLRRKRASLKSGEAEHKPVWFAYDFMESFLGPVYESSTTIDAQDVIEITVPGQEDDDEGNDPVIVDVMATVPPAPSSSNMWPTIRRESPPAELEDTKNHIKETFSEHNEASNKSSDREEDECDLFGKILTKKLRKLPERERLLFMHEIDGMFIRKFCTNNTSPVDAISYSHTPPMGHMNRVLSSQTQHSDSSDL